MSANIGGGHSAPRHVGGRRVGAPLRLRLLGLLVTLAWGLVAPGFSATQRAAHLPRVALLDPGSPTSPQVCPAGFRQGVRDLGYVEGQNVVIESRYAEGQLTRLPTLAAELVHLAPDVLWTHSTEATQAAKQATTTIPIVIGVENNMVEEGFVANLARPGGNLTGMELRAIELTGKRLQLLKEAVPTITRVAVLVNPTLSGHERVPGNIEAEARALGVQLQRVEAGGPDTFEAAFAAMAEASADALLIMEDAIFARNRHRLLDLARLHRLPTVSGGRHFAEAGSLLSYGADVREFCQRSAVLADKILKGAKPADLPVERADKFYLVVNLKTAQALGLTLSPVFLSQADEVLR
jgi:putative tryptophan/tyrosine transport system substrate-binding protein